MIVETQNQLTKDEIMERLLQRVTLKDMSMVVKNQLSTVQARIRQFKETLKDLDSIKESIAKESESGIIKK